MSTADNQQGIINPRLKAAFLPYLPMIQQPPITQQLLSQIYRLLFACTVKWVWAVWQNILFPWLLSQAPFRVSKFWPPGFLGAEEAFFMLFYIFSALYILSEVFPVLPKKLEWIHDYSLHLSTQLQYFRYHLDVHVKLYARRKKYDTTAIPANPRSEDNGSVLMTSPKTQGTHLRKNIFVLSRTGSGDNHQWTGETTESAYNDMPEVILDSQAHVNCTGNFSVFSNVRIGCQQVVLVTANGEEMPTIMSGSVRLGNLELNDVHYCPDLGNRVIVSGSTLDTEDYYCGYGRGKCSVRDLRTGRIVGEGRLVNGNYVMDYLRIPRDRTPVPERQPGLVTTAWKAWKAVCSFFASPGRLGLT